MNEIIFLCLGGGCGAVARYLIYLKFSSFPAFGILAINVVGSFALGLFIKASLYSPLDAFLVQGFLGAFTTFSTFVGILHALQLKQKILAISYLTITIILCPGVYYLGTLIYRFRGWINPF